jgi:hypothetical protein
MQFVEEEKFQKKIRMNFEEKNRNFSLKFVSKWMLALGSPITPKENFLFLVAISRGRSSLD